MEAKERLNRVRNLDVAIGNKLAELEMLRQSAQGVKSLNYSLNRVQSSMSPDSGMAATVSQIVDIEKDIFSMIADLIKTRDTIVNEINAMPNPIYSAILFKRYIEGKRLEEISNEMHYQYGTIRQLHGKALKAFESANTNEH